MTHSEQLPEHEFKKLVERIAFGLTTKWKGRMIKRMYAVAPFGGDIVYFEVETE